MPTVGFEHTIPAFERAKAVHALDRVAIVIGQYPYASGKLKYTYRWIFSHTVAYTKHDVPRFVQ
jgi:hypothetical protein